MPATPTLAALDWGTSSLRAYLLGTHAEIPAPRAERGRGAGGAGPAFPTFLPGGASAGPRGRPAPGRPARGAAPGVDPAARDAAFAAGVAAARDGDAGGVAPRVFSTRARVLAGRL